MATISLCMIVRDEEAVLARCLESVAPLVDEMIIVDTGSSDQTPQIARSYAGRVYHFAWIDDFAAARNYAFSLAGCEFCMWLDADDVISPQDLEQLLEFKPQLEQADTVMLRYDTAFDDQDRPTFSYWRERIVRRGAQALWQGAVHEVIAPFGRIVYLPAAVRHRKEKAADPQRNLRIFRRLLEQGRQLSPREQFYFGRELYYNGRYQEAISELRRFLDEGRGWLENNIEACRFIAYCYYHLDQEQAALLSLLESLSYDAPRAEVCCELGRHFFDRQRYREAVFWYQAALGCRLEERSGGFISPDCYGYLPAIQLSVCYYRLGETALAAEYNERAGVYKPESPAYLQNRSFFAALPPQS